MADEKDTNAHSPAEKELENSGNVSLASLYGVNEKKLIRKLDFILLPAVSFLYLLSFLDRSNVANARVEGLVEDVKMTGNQYLTGLTLFFVGYILFEVPCQIVMKRTTPKFWLPTLTIAFGVVATLTGIVQSLTGFFLARFFLGIAEGGLFPGVVYFLSLWYKRQERQFRVALFFSAASLAGAFGGILAYGISFMNGIAGQGGWRWIFIIEGIFTVVCGFLAYFFIQNYPGTAKFLSKEEKEFLEHRLREDSDTQVGEGFKWANVAKVFKDPKCYLYCAAFHTMSLPLYTLSLFLPTIIKDLGFSAANAQLLTIPPYALATILTAVIASISERLRLRAPFIILSSSIACIGYIILLANSDLKSTTTVNATTGASTTTLHYAHPYISYIGVFFAAAGIYPSTALALSWPAVNVSGQTKRACAGGLQISLGNLGAVIGTQIYRTNMAPRYVPGHSVALAYLVCNSLFAAFTWWYLRRENRKRDAIEQSQGSPTGDMQGDDDVRFRFTT